jgi:hypothetical protein
LVGVWRQVAYSWDWDHPGANATVLGLAASAMGLDIPAADAGGVWHPRWAHWDLGASEVIGRHTGDVTAVVAVIPRPSAPGSGRTAVRDYRASAR